MQITLQHQPHLYPFYASLHILLINVTEIYHNIVHYTVLMKNNNTKTFHYIDYSNPLKYHDTTKSHNSTKSFKWLEILAPQAGGLRWDPWVFSPH